jgi:hypothetical protein
MKTLDDFLEEYKTDLNFRNIDYRRNARINNSFGLTHGYTKNPDNTFECNLVCINDGVDRSGIYGYQGQRIENIVLSPFNFSKSKIELDSKYGTLIHLTSDYDFELVIGYLQLGKDLVPIIESKLNNCDSIQIGDVIGRAGCFGECNEIQSHTEIISLDGSSKVLDDILYKKYGDVMFQEYSKIEIISTYQKQPRWYGKTADQIFENFDQLKKEKNIVALSKYRYQYFDTTTDCIRTKYSSEYLFGF